MNPQAPPDIDGYQILELLGEGGAGMVHRAYQQSLRRHVAIKYLRSDPLEDVEGSRRFLREIRLHQQLSHPNIVRFYDAGRTDSGPYLVMEYVTGGTLRERIVPGGLPLETVVPWMLQLARGLEALHQVGIVHRDLKPGNIFVTPDEVLKIGDYGLARGTSLTVITEPGALLGTPVYMAPEMLARGEASPAVDVYALGLIFFELFTGKLPFRSGTMQELMVQIMQPSTVRIADLVPGAPPWVDRCVASCRNVDPAARMSLTELTSELTAPRRSAQASGRKQLRGTVSGRTATSDPTTPPRGASARVGSGPVTAAGRAGSRVRLGAAAFLATGLVTAAVSILTHRSNPSPVVTISPSALPSTGADGASPVPDARTPAQWLDESDRFLREFRQEARRVRSYDSMRFIIRSLDTAGEFEMERRFRKLVDICMEVLVAADAAPAGDPVQLAAGLIAEETLRDWPLLELDRKSTLLRKTLPRIEKLVSKPSRDTLVRAIHASLALLCTAIDRGFTGTHAGRAVLLGTLEEVLAAREASTPDPLTLWRYRIEIAYAACWHSRFKDRGALVTGLEESKDSKRWRLHLIEIEKKRGPTWPEGRRVIMHALESGRQLAIGDEIDPATRLVGLDEILRLLTLLPAEIPREDADLIGELVMLRALVLQSQLKAARGEQLVRLEALERALRKDNIRRLPDLDWGAFRAGLAPDSDWFSRPKPRPSPRPPSSPSP